MAITLTYIMVALSRTLWCFGGIDSDENTSWCPVFGSSMGLVFTASYGTAVGLILE